MSPGIQPNLALILFTPWFAILSVLFWRYPREPRGAARAVFDGLALSIAAAAAFVGMHWGIRNADAAYGAMWPQILATSVAYGLYLAVMAGALLVRPSWLRRLSPRLPGGRP
ncbi:hypothetical protein [Marilutibacter chinensis]|uniref:Transmembrane protein n=1 Tax=Marilutibacter chinensis TaxID=2912247 RepID=A0ABS9HSC0_9GAMM|nr:hypothetical protein [Lysobacter chinensis]MCF7221411.1 hypothetical protein [Lysobacter chinensis]